MNLSIVPYGKYICVWLWLPTVMLLVARMLWRAKMSELYILKGRRDWELLFRAFIDYSLLKWTVPKILMFASFYWYELIYNRWFISSSEYYGVYAAKNLKRHLWQWKWTSHTYWDWEYLYTYNNAVIIIQFKPCGLTIRVPKFACAWRAWLQDELKNDNWHIEKWSQPSSALLWFK